MSEIILCLEQSCDQECKYGDDYKSFFKKGGEHYGHKNFFLDELYNTFDQSNQGQAESYNFQSFASDVDQIFAYMKKEFLVKMDLIVTNLKKYIQRKTIDDKVVQLLLALLSRDTQKVQEYQDIFHLLKDPSTISELCKKNIQDVHLKINYFSKTLDDTLSRINQLIDDFPLSDPPIQQKMLLSNLEQIQDDESQNTSVAFSARQEILSLIHQGIFDDLIEDQDEDLLEKVEIRSSKREIVHSNTFNSQNVRNSILHTIQDDKFEEQKDFRQYIESFQFSKYQKSQAIQFISTSSIKKQGAGGYSMAIIVPAIDEEAKALPVTIGFHIKNQQGWMAVGVCHLNTIVANNYVFKNDSIGHGAYMISQNGYSWSNKDKSSNDTLKSFVFTTNDVVYCTINPQSKLIIFKKNSLSSNQSYKLYYHQSDQQLYPCVCLGSGSNEMELIEPPPTKDQF